MRSRFCANCGMETHWIRWCEDCWRMVWKTLGITFVTALITALVESFVR